MIDTKMVTDTDNAPSVKSQFRIIDFFVLIFFLFTAAAGLYLFQQDLMRTIDSRDEEPAGIIVLRNNIVQRRHEDRVLWDRIFIDSPVYSGDLIRAAELSSAAINILETNVYLNENTLIRIQPSADGRGSLQVELQEGNLSVSSDKGAETGILLNLMGRVVEAAPGTALNASVGEEGLSVQVNEGAARFIEEGQSREITEGSMIALDEKGAERIVPAAVVTRPVPNARFLKTGGENLSVNFSWRRINLAAGEGLSLQRASDPNYTRDFLSLDGLDNAASVSFGAGQWYWRLMYENVILSSGRLSVADGSAPSLISPVNGSIMRYRDELPLLRFQWARRGEAAHYIVEICKTSDFADPVTRQSASSSIITRELGEGTWHWRVKPVFLLYGGEADWSAVSSFAIEQITVESIETEKTGEQREPEVVIPEPVFAVVPDITRLRTGGRYYTVRSGDTLTRIARAVYGNAMLWTKIVEANNIQNPDLIYPGQLFHIP